MVAPFSLAVASVVVNHVARLCAGNSKILEDLYLDTADLIKETMKDNFAVQQSSEILFLYRLPSLIAKQLDKYIENDFKSVSNAERSVVIQLLSEHLRCAKLGEASLVEAELNPIKLEKLLLDSINANYPNWISLVRSAGEASEQLYRFLLTQSCNYICRLRRDLPAFKSYAELRILQNEEELLKRVSQALDELAKISGTDKREKTSIEDEFTAKYRQTVVDRLDKLELFGLKNVGAALRPYKLTVAYVRLTAASHIRRENNSLGEDSGAAYDVETAIARGPRILISGDAGSGKTTLLQWLAVQSARSGFSGDLKELNGRTPIFIRLRHYANSELPSTRQMLKSLSASTYESAPPNWCYEEMKRGASVLVDGIDELPQSKVTNLREWLCDLCAEFAKSKFIISSRHLPVEFEWLDALHFQKCYLQPLSNALMDALIDRWHAAVSEDLVEPDERQRFEEYSVGLKRSISDNGALQGIASNPLMCAMLCTLYALNNRSLPGGRMELYRVALEMLLEKRDTARGILDQTLGVNPSGKFYLLEELAYWMMLNRYNEVPIADAASMLEPRMSRLNLEPTQVEGLVRSLLLRSGVIHEIQSGVLAFIHRTFMEWLAARAAVSHSDYGLLKERASAIEWKETVVFAAGHLTGTHRDQFVKGLLKECRKANRSINRNVVITTICCLETTRDNLSTELRGELLATARSLIPPKDFEDAKLIASGGNFIVESLGRSPTFQPMHDAATIRVLGLIGGNLSIQVLRQDYAGLEHLGAIEELLRAWAYFDEEMYREEIISVNPFLGGLRICTLDRRFGHECFSVLRRLFAPLGQTHSDDIRNVFSRYVGDRSLNLNGVRFFDFEEISNIGDLRAVSARNAPVKRLHALSKLPLLEELDLSGTEVGDVSGLRWCSSLRVLNLSGTRVGNLEPLRDLQRLELVDIESVGVSDVGPLLESKSIKCIRLTRDRVSAVDLMAIEKWQNWLGRKKDIIFA